MLFIYIPYASWPLTYHGKPAVSSVRNALTMRVMLPMTLVWEGIVRGIIHGAGTALLRGNHQRGRMLLDRPRGAESWYIEDMYCSWRICLQRPECG